MGVASPFLYTGKGIKLKQVAGGNDSSLATPISDVIQAGEFSEAVMQSGKELVFTIIARSGSGSIAPQIGESINSQNFTDINTDSAPITVPTGANAKVTISYVEDMFGAIRIANTSGNDIEVWVNVRLN